MLHSLAPLFDALVLLQPHNPRVLPPPTLSRCSINSHPRSRSTPKSSASRTLHCAAPASSPGRDGVVLATGSMYLISDLVTTRRLPARARLDAVNDEREHRRAFEDDGSGGRQRGGHDPGLLRDRLPARPHLSLRFRVRGSRTEVNGGGAGAPMRQESCVIVPAYVYTRPSMTPIAGIFGIHNHTASLIVDLALVVLAVIWLALIYWTFADARRRIADGILVACATITSLLPVHRHDRLHDRAAAGIPRGCARARSGDPGGAGAARSDRRPHLPVLRPRGREGLPALPACLRKLRDPCVSCGKPLEAELEDLPVLRDRPRPRSDPRTRSAQRPARARSAVVTRSRRWCAPPPSDLI